METKGAGTCASCGAAVAPTAGYLSERGIVCPTCFGRLEDAQRSADVARERESRSLTRRAWYLGGVHAMWAAPVVLSADWGHLPRWLSSLAIVALLVLAYTLRLRWRSAFLTALAVDAAGVVACLAWGVVAATRGASPAPAALGIFPLSLVGFTWWLRDGYQDGPDRDGLRRAGLLHRWLPPVAVVAALGGGVVHVATKPRPDPARALMQQLLPAWEAARVGGARPDEPTAREMLAAARPWPALAAALGSLDHAWPDEASVRASVGDVNAALADARLPYVVDVWIVARSPVLLTHALVTRVPWRVGARSVEVMRLRRLDHLNVELGLYGATNEGLPAVMLDRIEASLAKDIPQMFAQPSALAAEFNEVDRAVLARDRGWLEARLGPAVAVAAHALAERDRLFEEMRARLNGGTLALDAPDGFVLGAEWLGTVEPLAEPLRAGGPLVLEDDLQRLERADGELREGPTSRALAETVELLALSTEAHEARHAGDEVDPVGPPPPQLFAVMPTNSSAMIGMADKEARALLGEIHDGPFPACLTLARLVRGAFGRYARPTPHLFATLAILDQLAPGAERAPLERLTAACGLPDLELRRRTADAWQKLYGAPMPPARRLGPAQ